MNRYLKINHSELGPTGLFNQFTHLIHAIFIADSLKRNIYAPKFLPDYNSLNSVPFNEIIDIVKLNDLLKAESLKVSIVDTLIIPPNKWNRKYHNKVTRPIGPSSLEQIKELLQDENDPYLDIGLCYRLATSPNAELKLFDNLPFNNKILDVVRYCKEVYLGEHYQVLHLRLEDDWIQEMTQSYPVSPDWAANFLYNKFLEFIRTRFDPKCRIYIATHLGKGEHQYNFLLKRLKETLHNITDQIHWRTHFPEILPGREVDALVDYLICKDSDDFVGIWESTFARTIHNVRVKHNQKSFIFDCRYCPQLPFSVLHWQVSNGVLGLRGKLGYSTNKETNVRVGHNDAPISISAHAPSLVIIQTTTTMRICGYCHLTSEVPPLMKFICDENILGNTNAAGETTSFQSLAPGKHILRIESSNNEWAHSIWCITLTSFSLNQSQSHLASNSHAYGKDRSDE
jgi:hypothetical protein